VETSVAHFVAHLPAGNMTYDGTHSYSYDAENHLTQVDGGTTASYIYDPNGTRDARRLNRNEHRYVPF